ncbi:MAG: ASCH domain-containing protein [Pseudomonadota bacterium]
MTYPVFYFVTDIETDGPLASANSMLSFATVVVDQDGTHGDAFEAVLEPRPERAQDQATMNFWAKNPAAYAAATTEPSPPQDVMAAFAEWVREYPGTRMFTARPIAFDGAFFEEYLRTYLGETVLHHPWKDDPLFHGAGLDLDSFTHGVFGTIGTLPYDVPPAVLGDIDHTHRAIDDARGYANMLSYMIRAAKKNAPHPDDYSSPAPDAPTEFCFGDSRELCEDLTQRVRDGRKTATCMPLTQVAGGDEPMPTVGRQDIVTDWDGTPILRIETTEVQLIPFHRVPEDFALAEGEDDTLEDWRESHQQYFERNGGWSADMMLVCERFRVIEVLDAPKAG